MALPADLRPCLSSSAANDLKESIRVSNAESQLALPLSTTTVFGSSVICSPKGSAVCTGAGTAGGAAGVSAAAGGLAGAAEGLPPGVGAGVGAASGLAGAAGDGAGAGACASALPAHKEIAAGISAISSRRNQRRRFIAYSPSPVRKYYSGVAPAWCPVTSAKASHANMPARLPSHVRCGMGLLQARHGLSTQIHHTGQLAMIGHIRQGQREIP